MRALIALGQLFVLNMIYLLTVIFSLGLLVGPATSALFCFTTKLIQKRYDNTQIVKQYLALVKEKLKYALFLEIITVAIVYLCSVNLDNILFFNYPVILQKAIIIVQYIGLIEISLMFLVGSYLHGNYEFKSFKDLLLMSFYIAHRHILTTIILVASLLLIIYFVFYYLNAILFILLFSLLALWVSLLYNPICKKYVIMRENNHE
ncbi:MAG: DUF624 domain-containing protein [Bacilli bacterium]|jgi:uncharacterized membrane protein YesL|nr:DUF624 domain-containing protein [Bacilli bacterium]HHU23803.1 DUF624 domain-containing protein [Acholeplasmataceae bacterium]